MRIVSLLPAATDLVVTLALAGDLVGRTHECDWPPGELEHVAGSPARRWPTACPAGRSPPRWPPTGPTPARRRSRWTRPRWPRSTPT